VVPFMIRHTCHRQTS